MLNTYVLYAVDGFMVAILMAILIAILDIISPRALHTLNYIMAAVLIVCSTKIIWDALCIYTGGC